MRYLCTEKFHIETVMTKPRLHSLCLLSLLLSALCLAACSNDDDDSPSQGKTTTYRRTVVVYMAAQNSLGAAGASAADSSEIAAGAARMESTRDNLILFLDDASAPRMYRFYKSANGKGYYQKIYQYTTDANSADASTLQDVLTRVKNLYPSESYGLVMWSHGTAWLPQFRNFGSTSKRYTPLSHERKIHAIGIDVGPGGDMENDEKANGDLGDQMETADMARAVSASGLHLDYVYFDACLMQSVEVAYDLKDVTDYVVGSPAMTSAYGAYYIDQMKRGLFTYPANDTNMRTIVDTYYHDVMESDTTKRYYSGQGCVMSVIKTSALDALASATRTALTKATLAAGSMPDLSGMDGYIDFTTTGYPDCYDMSGALRLMLPENDYSEWLSACRRCVVYSRMSDEYYYSVSGNYIFSAQSDAEHYCGVSMFLPQQKYAYPPAFMNYNEAIKSTAWYAATRTE